MRKISLIFAMVAFLATAMFAQRTVQGTVTDDSGEPLIGASVVVKGTTMGAVTDIDGKYTLEVPADATELVVTYTGYGSFEQALGNSNIVNVKMSEGVTLDGLVVTALGIKREKKALGYATQEVGGEEVTRVKDANFINSLSGKVAGVDIKRSNTLGGSSNVIIRGFKSLNGSNQALFVVDGIPISNDNTNTTDQTTGRGGYDYGNAAMDINPEDVESINILKGAAATALYGSRGANGVVLVTTKKGTKNKKGIGVTFTTGVNAGNVDKTTMPTYQKQYGAGYGPYYGAGPNGGFEEYDVDGDGILDLVEPMGEDASYGEAYDPNTSVYNWQSIFPELSTYGQKFPFVASDNDASNSFYQTSMTYNNSIAIDGATDDGSFRLSYTNFQQTGIVPGSKIDRNNIGFASSYDLTDKLTATVNANYSQTNGKGRYGTGYDSRNPNQSFRQWYNVGTDLNAQRAAYENTGLNLSWNAYGYGRSNPTGPHYFDNPFFSVAENFQTDTRSRLIGSVTLDYELTDWLSVLGRVSRDGYSELQEERIAVGSVDVSEYSKFNRDFQEINQDIMLNAEKYLGTDEKISLSGTIGANFRKTDRESTLATTNGGLVVPGTYALSNSAAAPEAPTEIKNTEAVNGFFARATFGYDRFLYLDASIRRDYSSSLPTGENAYNYPAVSASFIFSELIDIPSMDFGKIRANYATVGNGGLPDNVDDSYGQNAPFNGNPTSSADNTLKNQNLKDERTTSFEVGAEMKFFKNRLGIDASFYNDVAFDQILRAAVTTTSGSGEAVVNAGEIETTGIELTLTGTPVKTANFSWDLGLNWSTYESVVNALYEDQTNLQLASVQGGITINATVGESYGAIWGTNYVYNGDDIVVEEFDPGSGRGMIYSKTGTPETIGNITPDWKGGVSTRLNYKSISLSALVDIQKGGDFFSLDTWYGYATGIYDITAGTNDKGNLVRSSVVDGGGLPIDGVVANADGSYTANTEYGYMERYNNFMGYARAPNALHVHDASYVKLREVALTYSFPSSLFNNNFFQGLDASFVGRNLWIISKNAPYTDPEAGLSAGNVQGYQSGAYPSVKEVGVNLKFRF